MNICLLIRDFASGEEVDKNGVPIKSGAEFHAENHAKQLMKLGHNVTIMAKKRIFSTAGRENLDGIDLVRLHAPFRWLEIFLRLLTTHRNIDAFYILGTPQFAVWAILFAKFFGKPSTFVLTNVMEIFSSEKNWRNKIFSMCTNYIAISTRLKKGLIEEGKISPEKITVLPQGISTKRFSPPDEKLRLQLRKNLDISPDAKVLLFCARVVINKGVDTLQTVWKILHEKFPEAVLVVVGGGTTDLIEDLKKLSAKLGNSIKVIGEVKEPENFYRLADVYIFPSRYEGLPTSLIEAMSCGLPAVVSDIGGCEDLIFDDVSGWRVDAEDAKGFAEKIEVLFNDDDLRKKFADNAAKFIHETCDYSTVIPKLANIISSK